MPIKDKTQYPTNWKQISLAIRERAGNRCEWEGCGIRNGSIGYRLLNFTQEFVELGHVDEPASMEQESKSIDAIMDGYKIIRIILTVAHLNHTPSDCRPENLMALCQMHHLRLDAKHHAVNAAKTRKAKAMAKTGQLELVL
jgi:hypothetical protein